MDATTKTFKDNPSVASAFAKDFVELLNTLSAEQSKTTVALSGGSTPKLLFQLLAEQFANATDWSRVHFFWGDERCVPPDSPESNFGEADRLFLSKVDIPAANVHRVQGENAPDVERKRYDEEIRDHVSIDENGTPAFDLVILGMGSDGHTASIFPHQMELLSSDNVCEVATHPESGQKRITITGKVINSASRVCFLVTGSSKATVLGEIFSQAANFEQYPTAYIKPASAPTFYLDEAAASQLPQV